MKPHVLAGIVAGVFAVGIAAGALLFGGGQPAPERTPIATASPAAGAKSGQQPTARGAGAANPAAGPQARPGAGDQPTAPGGTTPAGGVAPELPMADVTLPPGAPSLPPPEALAEGERSMAEMESGELDGRVTHLVYEFDTPEEREAHEQRRRASWEARLAHENDIKLRIMREEVGITAAQESRLREILAQETVERARLVEALTAQEIARGTFDEGVRANLSRARGALQELLTAEQYQAYLALKPREQVLREEGQ
jgi:hypothetical protein